MFVKRFENAPISSNCFVIFSEGNGTCIVVDPGTVNCSNIIPFLEKHKLDVEYCFLTHEHIDHTAGLKFLRDKYNFRLVCSSICAAHLNDTKYNLSAIIDQFTPIDYLPKADISFDDYLDLQWQNTVLHCYVMPGHSQGSAIMVVDDELIVGDNLIKGARTKANFFGGSKKELLKTMNRILGIYGDGKMMVHCGHFKSCSMTDIKPEIENQIKLLKDKI